MRKVEIAFIFAVLGFAVAFSVMSSLHTGKARAAAADVRPVSFGAAGKARDVDIEKVRRLIRQGYLSDHEAMFYGESPVLPERETEQAPPGHQSGAEKVEAHDEVRDSER